MEAERIIRHHLETHQYFQTMNPKLRCKNASKSFLQGMPGEGAEALRCRHHHERQIVLCKGINDGEELDESIRKSAYAPVIQSVSVVPAGLTKFRKGLYPLELFNKEDACQVLDQIHGWQQR